MRIVCTNCAARYEVDATSIPAAGRDVQCSACGQVWFFTPPAGPVPDEPDTAAPKAMPLESAPDDMDDDGAPPADPPRPPPPVDPAVLAVLRAEAEREVRARRAEADLTGAETATPRRRLPPAPSIAANAAPAGDPPRRPGRDRLPAIENIDPEPPTLATPSAADPEATPPEAIGATPHTAPPATDSPDPVVPDAEPAPRSALSRHRVLVLGFVAVAGLTLAAVALHAQARSAVAPPAGLVAFADALDSAGAALSAAGEQLRREVAALVAGR